MKSKLVCKSLAKYPTAAKVRKKVPLKGIQSTIARPENRVTYDIPPIEDPALNLIPI